MSTSYEFRFSHVPTSVLELKWANRHGYELPGGGRVAARRYLDFVIDGRSLRVLLRSLDLITPLGWVSHQVAEQEVLGLLLRVPSDLEGNRRALYVCPECGDIGCGAITAVVESEGNRFIWHDFGYQGEPDTSSVDRRFARSVGPFAFERAAYANALRLASK